MTTPRVLVSGASIGGPATAYWLTRYGFDVTVVEQASAIRTGGQAVDVGGPVHLTVLERTGILDDVRAASVPNPDGSPADARGQWSSVARELVSDRAPYVAMTPTTTASAR